MMLEDIETIETNTGYYIYRFNDTHAYMGSFGNCQNFTICAFEELLYNDSDEAVEDTRDFFLFVKERQTKNFVVIDIRFPVYARLKSVIDPKKFNVSFVVETPYENYNGTQMALCILDISKLRQIK